jgi:hypothetical protein
MGHVKLHIPVRLTFQGMQPHSKLRRSTAAQGVNLSLGALDRPIRQNRVSWRHLDADLRLDRLQLIDRGDRIAAVDGCQRRFQTRRQRPWMSHV